MLPGDTSLITLEFSPTASLALNSPINGNFLITPTNGNQLDIPFTLEKVSDNRGNLIVDVINQYTYFTDEAPHLANAHVKISHYFTGEVYADGYTDSLGLFRADSLPEGNLRLVVDAEKHKSYDGVIYIQPEKTIEESIFLEFQAISFSWDVVPTTIEDEYEVNLVMTFETNVPVPVVVMDAPKEIPQLEGDETYDFFITLTNKGLITANELTISMPEDPEYEFITNYKTIDLLAQQAIQVPAVMRRKDSSFSSGGRSKTATIKEVAEQIDTPLPPLNFSSSGGGCGGAFAATYWYICQDTIYSSAGSSYSSGGGCGISGGGGSGGRLAIGGGGFGSSYKHRCNELNDCPEALALAAGGCLPGPLGTGIGAAACLNDLATNSNPRNLGTVLGCASVIPFPGNCVVGMLGGALSCGLLPNPTFLTSINASSRNNTPNDPQLQVIIDNFHVANEGFKAISKMDSLFFGDLRNNENYREILNQVATYIDNQVIINPTETQAILNALAEFDIPQANISAFIMRWNTTVEAWDNNIFSPTPAYPNIIDKAQIDAQWTILHRASLYATNQEYDNIYDLVTGTFNDFDEYMGSGNRP